MTDVARVARKKGFTLLELAVVVAIMGILFGIGMRTFVTLLHLIHEHETKAKIERVVDEVKQFVLQNGRLPDATEFKEVAPGNFTYIYSQGLVTNCTSCKICESSEGLLTVKKCEDNTCSKYDVIKDVAFVVVDSNIQVQVDNSTVVLPAGSDYGFDYVTIYDLRSILDCNKCKINIIPDTLPAGVAGQSYSASLYVISPGGTGGSYVCISGSLPYGITSSTQLSDDCNSTLNYVKTNNLTFSGTPTKPGTFLLHIFVKDNFGNKIKKDYVFVINPHF